MTKFGPVVVSGIALTIFCNMNLWSAPPLKLIDLLEISALQEIEPDKTIPITRLSSISIVSLVSPAADLVRITELADQTIVLDPVSKIIAYSVGPDDVDYFGDDAGELIDSNPIASLGDVAIHPNGTVLISDPATGKVAEFFTDSEVFNYVGIFKSGLMAPNGVYIGRNSEVFLVETGAARVSKFNLDGAPILFLDGNNLLAPETGGPAFVAPIDIDVSDDGNIFVADNFGGSPKIFKFSPSGNLISQVSLADFGITGSVISSLVVNKFGHIYVADSSKDAIYKFSKDLDLVFEFEDEESGELTPLDSLLGVAINRSIGGIVVTIAAGAKTYREMPGLEFTELNQSVETFNPFTGPLSMSYSLGAESLVTVLIKPALNPQFVERVIQLNLFADLGTRGFTWDGLNSFGELVPEGDYTVQVIADAAIRTPQIQEFNTDFVPEDEYEDRVGSGFAQEEQISVLIFYPPSVIFENVIPGVIQSGTSVVNVQYQVSKLADVQIAIERATAITENSTNWIAVNLSTPIPSEIGLDPNITKTVGWDGNDSSGVVPDGVYRFKGLATVGGDTGPATYVRVGVDRNPLIISSVMLDSDSFAPNSPTVSLQDVSIDFSVPEQCDVSVRVLDSGRTVVRHLITMKLVGAGSTAIDWDGRDDDGQVVAEGDYFVEVEAVDLTGNSTDTVTKAL